MVYIKAMFMIKVLLRLTITVMLGKCDGDNHTVNVRDGAGCRDVTGVIDGNSDYVSHDVGVYECDSVGMASADGGKVCC